jgi:signal transduction histidine kinase
VLRHSEARNARINLRFDVRFLTMLVVDDGKGITPEQQSSAAHSRHWGIRGMRERAAKLNGEFKIISSPLTGTELSLQVPANIAYSLGVRDRIMYRFYRRWIVGRSEREMSDRSH